jgi:Na+/H+ antiporter NhaD/arsenite permease-like protein
VKQTIARLMAGAGLLLPLPVMAGAQGEPALHAELISSWFGIVSVLVFVAAYGVVITEEQLHMRKSKPVMVAAGIIWFLVALAYHQHGASAAAEEAVKENILEYGELMLFLLAAMTYIATLEERRVFDALRAWLVSRGFTLKAVYWITGLLAFFISPIADNLTTALLMGAVVLAVAPDKRKFVALSCINIVVAANAGGAFSPFGDITTLMVWQRGKIPFLDFFYLFLPALVNWFVPALIMSFAVPKGRPAPLDEAVYIKRGGITVIFLFFGTIAMAVLFHSALEMPPMLGMMTGLGVLKLFGYYLKITHSSLANGTIEMDAGLIETEGDEAFDIFTQLQRAEWDTLMFFYGVILSVGGLATLGYLGELSQLIYTGLGHTQANVLVGIISAIVDNIPVMYAVLSMDPNMAYGQWMLVTLTAGVGGSLMSIGSAAGVGLMGQARGVYTFMAHLRWSWAVALGYGLSIWLHLIVNHHLMLR